MLTALDIGNSFIFRERAMPCHAFKMIFIQKEKILRTDYRQNRNAKMKKQLLSLVKDNRVIAESVLG